MIKVEGNNVEVEGTGIDILAEFALLTAVLTEKIDKTAVKHAYIIGSLELVKKEKED